MSSEAPIIDRGSFTFLSLAPHTSTSYPQQQTQTTRRDSTTSSEEPASPTRRRASTTSSTGTRVLKLSPVHWGEHLEEHKEDFHDVEHAQK